MARGTDFGGIHSHRDLGLIQQSVEVQPAEPKLNIVDVPGADGSKDLSDKPAGRVVYKNRTVTWTFALYPGASWPVKFRQVSNALNGLACHITLDDDPGYYFEGRLAVKKYNRDATLRQITVEATCAPYMLKQEATTVRASLTSSPTTIDLPNDRRPVVPEITVTAETTLVWEGNSFTLAAGTHRLLDIVLREGQNELAASGSGTITIKYQEGAL